MLFGVILRGFLIGLTASIPLGPIGVLCIQRTLSKNFKAGFVSGLGAASADSLYATIAFFSLSIVTSFIQENINVIKVVGGICIMVVGLKIFTTNPVVQIRRNRAGISTLWNDFISVFAITLANPAYILIFVALFAAVGFSRASLGLTGGLAMIGGVMIGTSSWWFVLTFVVNLIRKKFRPRHMLWINRIAGIAIITLGLLTSLLVFFNTPLDGILH